MKTYYEATGDPRVPVALEKNYLTYTPEELSESRYIINIEGILWTYALTGNPSSSNWRKLSGLWFRGICSST